MPSITIAFYRVGSGGVMLLILTFIIYRQLGLTARNFRWLILCAGLNAMQMSLWHRSIHSIGPGLATVLVNFEVFFLAAIGAIFLHERLGWRYALSVPMALAGLFLLVGQDPRTLSDDYLNGLWLALSSALLYGCCLLILRKVQLTQTAALPLAIMAVVSISASIFIGLDVWVTGHDFTIPTLNAGLSLLCYGFMGQVLGWVLLTLGISRTAASRGGLILLMQPALAVVWDVMFFARPFGWIETIGAFSALAAIYLGSTDKVKQVHNDL